jgi:hypothetical protein
LGEGREVFYNCSGRAEKGKGGFTHLGLAVSGRAGIKKACEKMSGCDCSMFGVKVVEELTGL